MQTETVTIGTCTADKLETLDKLLCLGITACTTVETMCSDSTNVKLSEGPYKVFSVHESDIPSIPLPSTSTATTSRQLTSKAKTTETKSHVKLNTFDENPPEDIPLPSDIETDKHDDPAITPDIPESIEEPKYMRLHKTYIKRGLHVSLTKFSDDEIQQKPEGKPSKPTVKP